MKIMQSPLLYFSELPDYRDERYIRHKLLNIIAITLSAIICGAADWYDVEDYGKSNKVWLSTFLDFGPSGKVPSHDTYNRFFSLINPIEFEKCFIKWVQAVCELTEGRLINIDGKTLRGSKVAGNEGSESYIHMVSAWCNANGMVVGQEKVDGKSNEITAIPKLLEFIVIKGCLITSDAIGCQEKIAAKITAGEGDYILAVKENQPTLLDNIEEAFEYEKTTEIKTYSESNVGHGRIEKRIVSVIHNTDWVEKPERWSNLKSLIMVKSEREDKKTGKKEQGTRFYISSKKESPEFFQKSIRGHWSIENKLHWQLDVTFGEDASKKVGNAAQNFSMMNKMALNMINKHKLDDDRGAKKISVKRKRKMAGWNNDYLIGIILSYDFG